MKTPEHSGIGEEGLRRARFVATYWLGEIMASETLRQTGMSHPLAMVIAALDGETDPAQLGISDDQHDAFRFATADTPTSEDER